MKVNTKFKSLESILLHHYQNTALSPIRNTKLFTACSECGLSGPHSLRLYKRQFPLHSTVTVHQTHYSASSVVRWIHNGSLLLVKHYKLKRSSVKDSISIISIAIFFLFKFYTTQVLSVLSKKVWIKWILTATKTKKHRTHQTRSLVTTRTGTETPWILSSNIVRVSSWPIRVLALHLI